MANIPGISGYVQPGVFARDRVISRGVTIPGGLRIPCIMGEGLREETVVEAAIGNGRDGNPDCSPDGNPAGRFFSLQFSPIISGRTEVFLNGSSLRGIEAELDGLPFDGQFDFRLDPDTGCLELQGASIGDQDGKKWSASSINVGNGYLPDGICGSVNLISILDQNAPPERWTLRAVSVIRDSNGDPIPGQTTFTLSGSVSGQITTSGGQPILFHDSYYTSIKGAVSGNEDVCQDGFVVATSDDFGLGNSVVLSGDATPLTTRYFKFDGDLITQGQVVPGDFLCADGYTGIEIEDIDYDLGTDTTTLTLVTDSFSYDALNVAWEIRAKNLFIDDPSVVHNGITGAPATAGAFSSSDLGKVLAICGGDTPGLSGFYRVDKVTSSRRLRVSKLGEPNVGFPNLVDDDADGLGEKDLEFHMLETNGVLVFGIKAGNVPFEVGDKFFIDVKSRVLKKNDRLEVKYIAESDINDPELFVSAQELAKKHGQESVKNTLSLGARLCFENQAPYVLALQCKPPIPRRTTAFLVQEANSNGQGGFKACGGNAANCEPDDLTFIIPRPLSGLQKARPQSDSQVNFFVVRKGVETQIFPNKVEFYNSQIESPTGQAQFISNPSYPFSYTIINTDTKIIGQGFAGSVAASSETFTSSEVNFDGTDVGKIIVVQSLKDSFGSLKTKSDDISLALFGSTTVGIELIITDIVDDQTVIVVANDGLSTSLTNSATEMQFFIKDESDVTNKRAAVLFHKDLVSSGTLKSGDGIKISYVDEVDADFFDTNWFEAFEALEAEECQIVVPLPLQNRGGIFRAAIQHVETMSTIAIQKERVTMFGAQQGVTPQALIGLEEVAVEDIGILEGIQGDDPEEVLDGNTEDLQNYKLSDNYTSNRAVYFYPDQVVRSIQGANTFIDGFYMAAAAAGYLSATQNVAIPLTNKVLSGFTILRDKKYRPVILNQLGAVGATVVQPVVGGGQVLAGRTTSQSGFVEDEEVSIIFIRDRVKEVLRQGLKAFVGVVEDNNTQGAMTSRIIGILSSLVSQGLITGYKNVKVERDKLDPRQWNVYLRFQPAYPINYIFIDIEVGIL
jgi:hypothetical protein